jgi:hypothetical protein
MGQDPDEDVDYLTFDVCKSEVRSKVFVPV